MPGQNGVAVSTWVPKNLFEFASDKSIAISGVVSTNLGGSNRRELRTATLIDNGRKLQAVHDESPFQLKVALAGDLDSKCKALDMP